MESAVGVDIRRLLVESASAGDIRFGPNDRLYAGFRCFLLEFDCGEHVAVVGDRQGRHFEFFGKRDNRIKTAGAVKKRVLAMRMQVNKIGIFHISANSVWREINSRYS